MKDKQINKTMGRPIGSMIDNPKVVMPSIMVDPEKLLEYKQAAEASGSNFSQWVRGALDKAAK